MTFTAATSSLYAAESKRDSQAPLIREDLLAAEAKYHRLCYMSYTLHVQCKSIGPQGYNFSIFFFSKPVSWSCLYQSHIFIGKCQFYTRGVLLFYSFLFIEEAAITIPQNQQMNLLYFHVRHDKIVKETMIHPAMISRNCLTWSH